MVRVFIVAATPVLRAGLRILLNSPEIQVSGEAAELPTSPTVFSGADVLLLANEDLPEELASLLADSANNPGLLVLSDQEKLIATLHALPLPGWGILPLEAPANELQAAVTAVAQGLVIMPRLMVKELLGQRLPLETTGNRPLDEPLTGREQEVLELLSQGLSNKLIARRLQISENTVKFHVSSLYTKLDASSRAEAVSRGARLGLITF
jgi:DNA-binding NarL/FixJ family response regulator